MVVRKKGTQILADRPRILMPRLPTERVVCPSKTQFLHEQELVTHVHGTYLNSFKSTSSTVIQLTLLDR